MTRLAVFAGVLCVWASYATAYLEPTAYYRDDDGKVYEFYPFSFPAILRDETTEYAHGVLGDAVEYKTIALRPSEPVELPDHIEAADLPHASAFRLTLPPGRVFEDIEARAVPAFAFSWTEKAGDLGFRHSRAAVVEADALEGAQLALYAIGNEGIQRVAETPPIGRGYRWLAPAGIEDFDGDGSTDIAYVETPHLKGILKIVTQRGEQLLPVAAPMAGFSNHSIGEDFITSGVRLCRPRPEPKRLHGNSMLQEVQPELLVPSLDRKQLLAVRVEGGVLVAEKRPEPPSLDGIRLAQTCPSETPQ